MSRQRSEKEFYRELQRRIGENKQLYSESSFHLPDSSCMRFVATYLGVNPWKVIIPVAGIIVLLFRVVLGTSFAEFILDILGGGL